MVVTPGPMGVARPLGLTVATDVFDEVQVTCVVKSRVVPSENLPVAVYCWLNPTGMVRLPGDIKEGVVRLPGVTNMSVNSTCSHVVRDTAKNPRNNIARTNRIFFTRTPPGEITANLGLRMPVVKDPKPMLNRGRRKIFRSEEGQQSCRSLRVIISSGMSFEKLCKHASLLHGRHCACPSF
jgi:hypothetical protein